MAYILNVYTKQEIQQLLASLTGGGGGGASVDLTPYARKNGVPTDGDDLNKLYNLIQALNTAITGKLSATDLVDNLTSNLTNKALTANQGRLLKGLIDTLNTSLAGKQDKLISGTTIKSINGVSLLGTGDLTISGGSVGAAITDAGQLTSGTLDDNRLSTNIPRKVGGKIVTTDLNIATTTTAGVVKAGTNISIATDGTISTAGSQSTTNASQLTSGTLDDARLSVNVPKKVNGKIVSTDLDLTLYYQAITKATYAEALTVANGLQKLLITITADETDNGITNKYYYDGGVNNQLVKANSTTGGTVNPENTIFLSDYFASLSGTGKYVGFDDSGNLVRLDAPAGGSVGGGQSALYNTPQNLFANSERADLDYAFENGVTYVAAQGTLGDGAIAKEKIVAGGGPATANIIRNQPFDAGTVYSLSYFVAKGDWQYAFFYWAGFQAIIDLNAKTARVANIGGTTGGSVNVTPFSDGSLRVDMTLIPVGTAFMNFGLCDSNGDDGVNLPAGTNVFIGGHQLSKTELRVVTKTTGTPVN